MGRATLAILSTENLLHNLAVLAKASKGKKIMAMIKANAYGHGLRSVAKRVSKHVDSLGVASIDEALAIRKVGVNTAITLVEGVFEPSELLIASAERFHVVFHNEEQLNWLEKSSLPLPLKAWMKIDSGMGRLGFSLDQAASAHKRLSQANQIVQPIGIMSHFACADHMNHPLNQKQMEAFHQFAGNLPGLKSFSNSPALFNFPSAHYDIVRPGLALYGISPIQGKTAEDLGLLPVMTLQTQLISIRSMKKGSSIGYGSHFICQEDMLIGIAAMGYGDGYPRTASNGTPLLVNNVKCQLVGRVSMDMLAIDLSACPHAKVGDPVTLWGSKLPIEEVAPFTSQIPYDLVTGVQQRVKFHWTIFE